MYCNIWVKDKCPLSIMENYEQPYGNVYYKNCICLEKLPSKIWTYDIGSEDMLVSEVTSLHATNSMLTAE
jgi:hypothetical protein